MNLEQARKILADEDVSDTKLALEAVATLLRFKGIADRRFVSLAAEIEAVAASLDEEPTP